MIVITMSSYIEVISCNISYISILYGASIYLTLANQVLLLFALCYIKYFLNSSCSWRPYLSLIMYLSICSVNVICNGYVVVIIGSIILAVDIGSYRDVFVNAICYYSI